MRLAAAPSRPQIAGSPLASLALLLLSAVVITGLFSASRGPGLRFATPVEAGPFPHADLVQVRILPGGFVEVDGAPVGIAGLADGVAARLRGRAGAGTLLIVSPDATYGDMVAAYAAIASVPDVNVAIPTRAWVEAQGTP